MKTTPEQEAIYNHAAWSTVGLGPVPGTYARGIPFAGGVLIEWQRRTFVVTVNHFMDELSPAQVSIIFPPEAGIRSLDCPVTEAWNEIPFRSPELVASSIRLDPVRVLRSSIPLEDLAAIEIDQRIIPSWCEAHPLKESSSLLPKVGRRVLIVGQPNDTTRYGRNSAGKVSAVSAYVSLNLQVRQEDEPSAWTEIISDDSTFDPKLHFSMGLDFKKAKFDVQGMSGCAVWGILPGSASRRKVWRPKLELLGIQVAQLKGRNALKATRVNAVRKLLREARE